MQKGVRNCRGMENYKFSYGLAKTKYMIIQTGSEKAVAVEEAVKQGFVEETDKYQYVGLFVNKKGNLASHFEFLKGKIKDSMSVLMNTGHESNVGKEALRVKLHLYSSTIVPAILNNLETWEGITCSEYQELEKIQSECLKKILHVPTSSPYYGILMEVGLWPLENFLWYRKLMLYHNIVNSKDNRLGKIVWTQQHKYEMPNSFDYNIKKICGILQLNCEPGFMKCQLKSAWKRLVKSSIHDHVAHTLQQHVQRMTKLRFLKGDAFARKSYVDKVSSSMAYKILLIRLNVCQAKENFRRRDN